MNSNGSVKYEMRLLFRRCQGEKPPSCGEREGEAEFLEVESFITEPCKNYKSLADPSSTFHATDLYASKTSRQMPGFSHLCLDCSE
jgi:hypothetical protein